MQDDFDIYLASSSPRRQELLQQIGVQYRIVKNDVAEVPQSNESPADYAVRIAREKAQAGWDNLPASAQKPVLGADTVVTIDGIILGKPRDKAHALEMLGLLSGRTHEVITAVAIVDEKGSRCDVSHSKVTFRTISEAERLNYWQTGEPNDKAGAYAIQGMAAVFVQHLNGSYSGVMGLPLYETANMLQRLACYKNSVLA